jgi:hypothetical protein
MVGREREMELSRRKMLSYPINRKQEGGEGGELGREREGEGQASERFQTGLEIFLDVAVDGSVGPSSAVANVTDGSQLPATSWRGAM